MVTNKDKYKIGYFGADQKMKLTWRKVLNLQKLFTINLKMYSQALVVLRAHSQC